MYYLNCKRIVFFPAQDFEITCPPTGFNAAVNAFVTCKVNKTAFVSPCSLPAVGIKFHFTTSDGVKSEWCSESYTNCSNTGIPDPACRGCSCRCETDDGTFRTHRLDFKPTSAHAGGTFSCVVICLHSNDLPALTSNNCDHVSVGKLIM